MVVLVIYALIVLVELLLIFSFQFSMKRMTVQKGVDGPISILVCARNEEDNLRRCLNSLIRSNYELSVVEILVGDDHSTDGTAEIIAEFEQAHDFIHGIRIEDMKDGLIAKGNVLAQLVDQAQHEKTLIIDADMKVSSSWMSTMSQLLDQYDMVSGFTMIDKDFYRPQIQFFDWATVLHSMKAMADLWQPISILGNNMGFTKKAYDRVGGFKALGPTDVEDLGLLRRFQKHGLTTFQYLGEEGKAYTKAQADWKAMLEQRCRWMNGVFTHHWLLGIPAFFARLWVLVFAICYAFGLWFSPYILIYGLLFPMIKYLQVTARAGNRYKLLLSTPAIISLLDTFALIRMLLFGKVKWKGRKF